MKLRVNRLFYAVLLMATYTAVAILITWPLVLNLDTHLIGRTTDAFVHYWNNWWVQEALRNGQSPFFTSYLNYPYGASLVTQNFAWFNILPWLLLEPILDGIVAYNIIILLSLLLCGLAMYALVSDTLGDSRAAFLGGLIYMAWPFRLSQLDHPNLLATYWIPILFLFLGRLIRNGRWRSAILTGITIAFVGYTRWQILIPAFIMGLIYLAGTLPTWWPRKRTLLPKLTGAMLLALLLLSPPLILLINEQASSEITADVFFDADEQIMTTDWLAYLTPSRRHPQLKPITNPLYDQYYPDRSNGRRYPAYIGFSVLLLGLIGLLTQWRKNWYWLLMALLLMLLASGLVWRINGHIFSDLPMLDGVLAPLQFVRLMRIPERYVMFLALPTAMLAAYGWQNITRKVRQEHLVNWLTIIVATIILFEYAVYPARMQHIGDQTVLAQLAAEEGEFAILNLPLRFRFSKVYMFDQTVHQQPILEGHISREPSNLYQFITENEWFAALPALRDPGFLMAQLATAGVKYVIVPHECNEEEADLCLWKQFMPAPPVYEDDLYTAYATHPETAVAQQFTPELGLVASETTMFCSSHRQQIVVTLTWHNDKPLTTDYQLRLSAFTPEVVHESILYSLHEDWPSSQWPSGTLTPRTYSLTLPPDQSLEAFTLTLLDEMETAVAHSDLEIPSCDVTAQNTTLANVNFGPTLQMLEYGITADRDHLTVSPIWYAEHRPQANLKSFVHIINATTGKIVAQTDTVPKNWTFPTPLWHDGELVADNISVILKGVPPGEYDVAIGVIDATTGERLPLNNVTTPLIATADQRLLLPQKIRYRIDSE